MPMRLAIRLSLNDPQSLTNSYYESPMELHDFSPIRNDYPILPFIPHFLQTCGHCQAFVLREYVD